MWLESNDIQEDYERIVDKEYRLPRELLRYSSYSNDLSISDLFSHDSLESVVEYLFDFWQYKSVLNSRIRLDIERVLRKIINSKRVNRFAVEFDTYRV